MDRDPVLAVLAAVEAHGGRLTLREGEIVCQMPRGATLPPAVAAGIRAHKPALIVAVAAAASGPWSLDLTVANILALSDAERAIYRAALAHDTEALRRADAILAPRTKEVA